ncbi:hypothetical protein R1sor_012573 [Riccia sorocarpa]|uniref:NB-ARC domain-containing protein n=1 Tax=Riccia sorocarpa TaxID=122646 RepID=A0ABD3I6U4_9MARC
MLDVLYVAMVHSASKPPAAPYEELIAGICFYGTPHRGMAGTLLGEMIGDMEPNQPLLAFVELLSTPASRMDDEFRKIQNNHDWRIHTLGETNPTPLAGTGSTHDICSYFFCSRANESTDAVLVPEASARLGGDVYVAIPCDHFSICRPRNEKCTRYLHLVRLLDTVHQKQKERRRRSRQPDDILVGVDALLSTILDKHLKQYSFLGLCGMGGLGKTTMAKLVFDELQDMFEYSCFVEDLKSIRGGKKKLKEEVWGNMYQHGRPLSSEKYTENMWSQVTGKKIVIVFDDIDTWEHSNLLKEIARANGRAESRFIITSRHSEFHTVFPPGRWYTCEIPLLGDREAKNLFLQHAFPNGEEPSETLKAIVEEVVRGCGGLPLTLEVLGKYLGRTRDAKVWAEIPGALSKADSIACLEERVWSKLRMTFNKLGEQEQKMFLDFACSFSRADCDFTYAEVTYAWCSMYDHVNIRWQTLIDMSLVKKVTRAYYEDQCWLDPERRLPMRELFQMHEQLRSMGERIAEDSGVKSYLLEVCIS